MLTPAQLATLKADIAANNDLSSKPNNDDGAFAIAALYNQPASPDFFVFRADVPASEIFDQVTWANFTPADAPDNTVTWSNRSLACQGKQFNLQIMLQGQPSFNAGRVQLRAGLNDATTNLPSGTSGASRSGGWTGILPILRRLAKRGEKIFAVATTGVGTGTGALGATGNPGLMVFEGDITIGDVQAARALP